MQVIDVTAVCYGTQKQLVDAWNMRKTITDSIVTGGSDEPVDDDESR